MSQDKSRNDNGQFIFYQIGEGGILGKEYGEAAIPYQWFEKQSSGLFSVGGVDEENVGMDQVLIALKKE